MTLALTLRPLGDRKVACKLKVQVTIGGGVRLWGLPVLVPDPGWGVRGVGWMGGVHVHTQGGCTGPSRCCREP